MALAHKGLDFEPIAWRAVEKERIARSGGGTVPVLVDGDRWLRDSWQIAVYLDDRFSARRPLFGNAAVRAKVRFLDHWTTSNLHPLVFRVVAGEMVPRLAAVDQDYYRERTLGRFGKPLEDLVADPETALGLLRRSLTPLEASLAESPFLGGEAPDYGDYVVFGAFQWARVASSRQLVEPGSAIDGWVERLLDAFQGFARAQPAYRDLESSR